MGVKHRAPSRLPSTAARSLITGSARYGDRARGAPPSLAEEAVLLLWRFRCCVRRGLERKSEKRERATAVALLPGTVPAAAAPCCPRAERERQREEREGAGKTG